MDYNKKFKTTTKAGFAKTDVIEYFTELEFKHKDIVQKLENEIKVERQKSQKISSMRDHIFEDLQEKEAQLNIKISELEELSNQLDSQIEKNKAQEEKHQKQIQVLELKGERYDAIEADLSQIHSKAQFDASKMIDEAKEQAMESIFVIDKIHKTVEEYSSFMKEHNKKIEDKTTTDLNEIAIKQLEECEDKLLKIKLTFFKDNNIFDI